MSKLKAAKLDEISYYASHRLAEARSNYEWIKSEYEKNEKIYNETGGWPEDGIEELQLLVAEKVLDQWNRLTKVLPMSSQSFEKTVMLENQYFMVLNDLYDLEYQGYEHRVPVLTKAVDEIYIKDIAEHALWVKGE